ncbi:MAG: MFS transporter [Legionellales bacterium]|nr:MFS transporter [Legionellales bacterium]
MTEWKNDEEINSQGRWWLLFAISLMALLINIDYTAVNLALVTISRELHSSLNTIQWILAAYVLAWAAVVIPAGKMADIHGQRRFCITGLLLFIVSSIIAGLAPTTPVLIIARILQGLAAAIYIPTVYGLIISSFAQKERGLTMGLISIGVGIGMALGPTFGGGLLAWLGWRWIFYINIPIALLALLIIARTTRYHKFTRSHAKFDGIGSIILGAAVVFLVVSLSKVHYFTFSAWNLSILLLSILLILIFIFWEKGRAFPIIPLSLFKQRSYLGVIIGIFLEQYAFSALIVMLALYLQKVQGYSALEAGIIFLGVSLVFGFIAAFGGYWVDKRGVRFPAAIGFVTLSLGLLLFVLLTNKAPLSMLIFILLIIGIGMGVAFAAIRAGLVKSLDKEKIGIGSSLFLLCSLVGNTLGVIFTTIIFEVVSFSDLLGKLKKHTDLLPTQINQIRQAIGHVGETHYSFTAFSPSLQHKVLELFPTAIHHGVNVALSIAMLMAILAAITCYRLIAREV